MQVRAVTESDRAAWERMRQRLWPSQPGEHSGEIDRYFSGTLREPVEVLLAFNECEGAVGFIELSIRAQAEGCASDRVAFIEGWYVEPAARGKGVGAALIGAAESWGALSRMRGDRVRYRAR
jgi:aminoglycoside 6'-N-acetyltransferase I